MALSVFMPYWIKARTISRWFIPNFRFQS